MSEYVYTSCFSYHLEPGDEYSTDEGYTWKSVDSEVFDSPGEEDSIWFRDPARNFITLPSEQKVLTRKRMHWDANRGMVVMNFAQVLELIESRKEKVTKDSTNELLTQTHRYFRKSGEWFEEKYGTENQSATVSKTP